MLYNCMRIEATIYIYISYRIASQRIESFNTMKSRIARSLFLSPGKGLQLSSQYGYVWIEIKWGGRGEGIEVASNELQVNNCRRHNRQAMDSWVQAWFKRGSIESFRQFKQLMRLR